MIVGEPYFSSALLPWNNLYFWYVRTNVNHLLSDEPKVIPFKAHLQTIAGIADALIMIILCLSVILLFVVKLDNLHKLRSEISTVEGFNLSAYKTFIQQVKPASYSVIIHVPASLCMTA